MNEILKLAKDYSKELHLEQIPNIDSAILENFNYIYDENWEHHIQYPYEILTYLFDSYYVLPKRPDLASLFCWQAINHSYYLQELADNDIQRSSDKKGIELIQNEILIRWDTKYKFILEPYMIKLTVKTFHYVSSYMLKGYALKNSGIAEKFRASSYNSLINKIPVFSDILSDSYGKAYCNISNPSVIGNDVSFGIEQSNKGKSRAITHSFAMKLKELMLGNEVEITLCDATKQKYKFTEKERISFILYGILYASRCNNFHGNVAARMNSIHADEETFKMYTDIFLLEYIILAIHMNSQSMLSDSTLDKVKENYRLML